MNAKILGFLNKFRSNMRMKSLLPICFIILTSCSIYQSYGRKSFEEQSSSATLTEQLQIQLINCSELKETLNSSDQDFLQNHQSLISDNGSDFLFEPSMNEFTLMNKKLNHSCDFTANSEVIHQLTTQSIMEQFIHRRTQYFQELSK